MEIDRPAKEWAQIHDRTGDDPSDYMPLCKRCHMAYDGHYPPLRPGGNPGIGQARAAQQRAKTHCPQGHELTPDNIYWRGPDKKNRQCKMCTRERAAKRYQDTRSGPGTVRGTGRRGGRRAGTGDAAIGRKRAQQQLAKTHCPAGHEYTEENTYVIQRAGGRTARQCKTRTRGRAKAAREAVAGDA